MHLNSKSRAALIRKLLNLRKDRDIFKSLNHIFLLFVCTVCILISVAMYFTPIGKSIFDYPIVMNNEFGLTESYVYGKTERKHEPRKNKARQEMTYHRICQQTVYCDSGIVRTKAGDRNQAPARFSLRGGCEYYFVDLTSTWHPFILVGYCGRSSTSDSPNLFIVNLTKGGDNRINYSITHYGNKNARYPVD